MARARNIKPSIFKNELLGEADPLLTILFESLWCLADREGRLEDRPTRIKGETFPYRDGLNVDEMLSELERMDFIIRYVVEGQRLIQVLNFTKHQRPHGTEKDSELPEFSASYHITVIEPLDNGENPSHNALIPDSLLLIPDSPNPPPAEEKPRNQRPPSLPKSLESEINNLLDVVAPLTGAKDRQTLSHPKRWRETVEKVVREQHTITDFLAVVKNELERNKGQPQFFTPEGCLKALQAQTIQDANPFENEFMSTKLARLVQ
jgi:hypothetical protein